MEVTLPVSKSSGWLKLYADINIRCMLLTLLVSNVSGWLSTVALLNIWRIADGGVSRSSA